MLTNERQERFHPVIQVFLSSTFSDLKLERNALQREVFPKLEQLCLQRSFQFQAIDLRWGVKLLKFPPSSSRARQEAVAPSRPDGRGSTGRRVHVDSWSPNIPASCCVRVIKVWSRAFIAEPRPSGSGYFRSTAS